MPESFAESCRCAAGAVPRAHSARQRRLACLHFRAPPPSPLRADTMPLGPCPKEMTRLARPGPLVSVGIRVKCGIQVEAQGGDLGHHTPCQRGLRACTYPRVICTISALKHGWRTGTALRYCNPTLWIRWWTASTATFYIFGVASVAIWRHRCVRLASRHPLAAKRAPEHSTKSGACADGDTLHLCRRQMAGPRRRLVCLPPSLAGRCKKCASVPASRGA